MGENLLYLLNVSNPERLSSDSGWLFADILAPALVDHGAQVTVGCPVPVSDPRVGHVPVSTPGSKYRVRFTADVAALADLIQAARPSVVVANQIEHAGAVRAALVETRSSARLVGYCHYLPFAVDERGVQVDTTFDDGGLGTPVFMQFLTGLAACDRILVHSPIAERWLTMAAECADLDLGGRVRVVPPPRDPRLVATDRRVLTDARSRSVPEDIGAEHVDWEDGQDGGGTDRRRVVLYNHRLYEHYGTGRFLELAALLTANPRIRLVVADLFGTRAGSRRTLDASPERYRAALAEMPGVQVVSDGGDRVAYRRILEQADLALAPFRPGCTWSMSLIDCQAMGVPVLAPRLGWLADAVDPDLSFDKPHEAVKIIEALLGDPAAWSRASAAAMHQTVPLDPALIAARYLAAIS